MEQIEKAVHIINQGGIIIFPTDTAFGIGCRIDKPDSISRLFAIRKRPLTQSVPVLVDTVKMAQEYLLPIPKKVLETLIEPYWPGALTIVLPCKEETVPKLVRGGGNTLGVRIPNHPVTRAIIRTSGVPLLGPSANFHKEATPYSKAAVDPDLIKLVDYVVEGECNGREASTVIDCTKEPWQILRQGAVRL